MTAIQTFSTTPGASATLVEGHDTMRWLLLDSSLTFSPHLWREASAAGAIGVLIETPEGMVAHDGDDIETDLTGVRAYGPFAQTPDVSDLVAPSDAGRKGTFVHLHTHGEHSALDGLSTMQELVDLAKADGNTAIAITDHGNCSAHPALQRACDKEGLQPIFGMEAYFVNERLERPVSGDVEAAKRLREYKHLILLATDDASLRNLWAMSTEGYRDGRYYKPRIDWDTLSKYSRGIIATSSCLGGPLSQMLLDGDIDGAKATLSRFVAIFGKDFYLEIQPGTQADQIRLNHLLVDLSRSQGVPLVAAADGHYPTDDDAETHKIWMACQTSSDNEGYWHFDHSLNEAEMRQRLSYLAPEVVDEAIANTVVIAERCTARIESKVTMPTFHRDGGHPKDAEAVREMCLENWGRIKSTAHTPEVYQARFDYEFDLITRKLYNGYFLMVSDYVRWAKDSGILVGHARGSSAGSLLAYLMRITEVDPVEHDILFERFITEGRQSLPDIDVDLPASKRDDFQDYIQHRWGSDRVVRVGTHLRYKSKGIIGKLFGVFRDRDQLPPEGLADAKKISDIIGEAESGTAGLGMSWEQLWVHEGEQLEPYRRKYPEIFALAGKLVGRLHSYGQHPAGMVISTEGSLLDQLPLRSGDTPGAMISQFEFDDLDEMGFIKFDLLTIRTLDTLQGAIDGARAMGIDVNVYDFNLEYDDPMVWDEIGNGYTKGIFQVETASGTRLAKRMLPTSIADLSDMGSIVRPGPSRSGLTETYLRRRAGEEAVSFPDPRLEAILAPTQGVMIYQEQVMAACMILAGFTSTEADDVRKILGKKRVDKVQDAGYKFVAGCVNGGMDRKVATDLWAQMAEFSLYAFGKAHSVSYAMISYLTAWWRVHYPVPTLTALLSTVDNDRIPDFVREARRLSVSILPPDINTSSKGFTPDGVTIRYGFDSVKGIGTKAVEAITLGQPYTSFEDYLERKGPAANSGVTLLLAKLGAFDSVHPHRRALVEMLEADKDGSSARCVFKVNEGRLREETCSFDWSTEPRPVGRTGKLLKAKPLPTRCAKSCRQYTAPEPMPLSAIGRYTDAQIRDIEQELIGIHLSSSVFDHFTDEDRAVLRNQSDMATRGIPGVYLVAGIIASMRLHRDRSDREMAFIGLETEAASLDVVCFADQRTLYRDVMRTGSLVVCEIKSDSRGSQLKTLTMIQK